MAASRSDQIQEEAIALPPSPLWCWAGRPVKGGWRVGDQRHVDADRSHAAALPAVIDWHLRRFQSGGPL
jgi:hypothetical protein